MKQNEKIYKKFRKEHNLSDYSLYYTIISDNKRYQKYDKIDRNSKP